MTNSEPEYTEESFADPNAPILDLQIEEPPPPGPPRREPPQKGKRPLLKWILIGCVGIPLIVSLLCVGIGALTGISLLNRLQEEIAAVEEPTATPIVTLVPTADLSALFTPTPPPPPTPTPEPPGGAFSGIEDGSRFDLGQTLGLDLTAQDGTGITSLIINDNGQTIFSERYAGLPEIRFSRNWSPLADGRHRITAQITNRLGETHEVAGLTLFINDPDFLARNEAVFSRVQANVGALRGLTLAEPVFPYLMGVPDLRRVLRETGYSEAIARDDSAVLALFDLFPRGKSFYEDNLQYTSTNILGFYDPATGDLAIITNNRDLDILNEYAYAHELMHALQDQHFSLDWFAENEIRLGSDRQLARRALAEGEAELLQELYLDLGYIDEQGKNELLNALARLPRMGQSASLVDIPEVLVRSADFPYVEGKEFARALYNQSGWSGLDGAWAAPPESTEHILHPERYLAGDQPIAVEPLPVEDMLGDVWRRVRVDTLGELYLRLMLGRRLNADAVETAAAGWGGDTYQVFQHQESGGLILLWRLAWDSPADRDQFGAAYGEYAGQEYGGEVVVAPGAVCRQGADIACGLPVGEDWLIIRAPDAETAAALIASQTP